MFEVVPCKISHPSSWGNSVHHPPNSVFVTLIGMFIISGTVIFSRPLKLRYVIQTVQFVLCLLYTALTMHFTKDDVSLNTIAFYIITGSNTV